MGASINGDAPFARWNKAAPFCVRVFVIYAQTKEAGNRAFGMGFWKTKNKIT